MPELPEIVVFARDMQKSLVGRRIARIEVLQPKCLNLPPERFQSALSGARILSVRAHGKWLQVQTTQGWLLLNLGMGGEILLVERDHLPAKHRLLFDLDDGQTLAVNFWWFGYAHFAPDPADHPMVGKLGPHALDLSLDDFRALLAGRRGAIKALLLDQDRIAGIGNVYIQDPLFQAGIHPLRSVQTLSEREVAALWGALGETLQGSIDAGGARFELNLYGQKGGWPVEFLVGYREGKPCPRCGTTVVKVKTGSTAGYICPSCQPREGRKV
jgi:formamidopyrimidine-DNA glycosylase